MPKYKNWPEICGGMQKHPDLMREIIKMNMGERDNITVRLVRFFPDFFSETPVQGPIPWSALIADARKREIGDGVVGYDGTYLMELRGTTTEFGLPVVTFVFPESIAEREEKGKYDLVPDHLRDAAFGEVVELNGAKYVVVEVNEENYGNLGLVPLECIAIDL